MSSTFKAISDFSCKFEMLSSGYKSFLLNSQTFALIKSALAHIFLHSRVPYHSRVGESRLSAAACAPLHSRPCDILCCSLMQPHRRRTRVTRSRSRERGDARPSSRPLTTYSSVGQQQLLSLPPLCPGSLCFDCCRIMPIRELQNVVTRCCEYQCARTDSIDLCDHCFSINWDRFVAESGTFVGLSDEQISQGFSIWMFHKNHCK